VRALIAEHPWIARFLAHGLTERGHETDVAHDGHRAFELGRGGSHQAIILATALPGKHGVAVAQELRRAGVSSPILLLTAGEHEAEAAMRASGANGYLAKPFSFDQLLHRLRALDAMAAW